MLNNLQLILGGPGCGKTTRLLEIITNELSNGVRPDRIAFVSFTRAAALEAKERASDRFGLNPDDLCWFRTIHSLVYKQLGITRSEVIGRQDWKDFSKLIGFNVTGYYTTDDVQTVGGYGAQLLRISDYARATLMPLEEAWHELDEGTDFKLLKYFFDSFKRFKEDIGKIDFTDMLTLYIESGKPVDVDVAVIDEAQDLTAAQWRVVERAFSGVKRTYVGGDDDQAIYRWAGADISQFLQLSSRPIILPVSYRLPRAIHKLGNRISKRISKRYVKDFRHTKKRGHIKFHQRAEFAPIADTPGTWLLLARNNYMLKGLTAIVRDLGLNYKTRSGNAASKEHIQMIQLWEAIRSGKRQEAEPNEIRRLAKVLDLPVPQLQETKKYDLQSDFGWPINLIWHRAMEGIPLEDREWYIACLRRGEKLQREPRVRVETIHGVKGAEADNVLILSDISGRTEHGYKLEPDNEHRVFYVGVTRAKESLHIVLPQTDRYYAIAETRRW